MKTKKKVIWICAAVVVVLIAVGAAFWGTGTKEVQFSTSKVSEGVVEITVMATGYVQPIDKVDVGTQVSGVIEKIFVDFNSQVTKGQLLAELDKSTLKEKETQAKASLKSAQADLTYSQQNYDRIKKLYEAKAATDVSYEEAVNKLAQAKTSVANAQASLHQAVVNLSYADITSPINGVVLNRAVEEGQTVAASFSTPTLFTIANDLTKMQVEADVDEADIGKVKLGQSVTFTVDAYSDDEFQGTVSQIRLQPTVTNNVVTYTVIIEAPNPEEKLFPGMTANIYITAQKETGILVPMEALAYSMSPEIMDELDVNPVNNNKSDMYARSVWVKTGAQVENRLLQIGINDGVHAVVVSGLSEGEDVILSANLGKKSSKNTRAAVANPLMPKVPGRR